MSEVSCGEDRVVRESSSGEHEAVRGTEPETVSRIEEVFPARKSDASARDGFPGLLPDRQPQDTAMHRLIHLLLLSKW